MQNSLPWLTHNLSGLLLDSFILTKAFRTVLPCLSFKSLSHAYLKKTSMTYNKYLTLLFSEENDSISAKSAVQILSLNIV